MRASLPCYYFLNENKKSWKNHKSVRKTWKEGTHKFLKRLIELSKYHNLTAFSSHLNMK